MEYFLMLAVSVGLVFLLFFSEALRARSRRKKYIQALYGNYEKLRDKEYDPRRYMRMGSYYTRHTAEGQIDDITWNDLDMDDVFKRMNYALSSSGEEYLYYTLRTPSMDEGRLLHLEDTVEYFGNNPDERVRVQLALHELGNTGKYSLYDYLDNLDCLGSRSSLGSIVRDLLFLPFIGLLFFRLSVGVLGIVALTIYNILTYFRQKEDIDPYLISFAYVLRLLDVCRTLEKHPIPVCEGEWDELRRHRRAMQGMRRNSFWVMSPARGMENASGNPIEILLDYIRMVFHVDLIKFNGMLKHLRGHIKDVDALAGTVGFLETAICVWEFRQSLEEGFCIPEFTPQGGIELKGGYHPLLSNPVKNDIVAERGVLLTGSNASGKSTFLKMTALNAILAQTIHTCTADGFRAPFFFIYSSMALKDSLSDGESYYTVEIRALKRILDAAASGKRPILCFVDEVLRGTNTVERIAASTQILASLGSFGILCFAATHDIELTDLLDERFDNYHFEEELKDGDMVFNYRLLPGKAATRNAIRLLELMGYDPDIIRRAEDQALNFLNTGVWQHS